MLYHVTTQLAEEHCFTTSVLTVRVMARCVLLLSKQPAKAEKTLLPVTAALATAVGTLTAIRIAGLLRILPIPAAALTTIRIASLLLILALLRTLQEPNEVLLAATLAPVSPRRLRRLAFKCASSTTTDKHKHKPMHKKLTHMCLIPEILRRFLQLGFQGLAVLRKRCQGIHYCTLHKHVGWQRSYDELEQITNTSPLRTRLAFLAQNPAQFMMEAHLPPAVHVNMEINTA